MDTQTLSFTIPAEDKRKLAELAKSEHRSVSQQVRVIIEESLKERAENGKNLGSCVGR
jgi:predicted DNA-binding protein